MKCLRYLLLSGLLSTAVWGQSASGIQPSVVRKCVALSCSTSHIYKSAPKVVLGSFASFHGTPVNAYPHQAVWQVSGANADQKRTSTRKDTSSGKTAMLSAADLRTHAGIAAAQ
jgi:hypothetical protein